MKGAKNMMRSIWLDTTCQRGYEREAALKWIDDLFLALGMGDDKEGQVKLKSGRTCDFGPRHLSTVRELYEEGHTPEKAADILIGLELDNDEKFAGR
jgi:hypothetical protein